MKEGVSFFVLLVLTIFVIRTVSSYTPPQPIDCSDSSIAAIWSSIFQVNSTGLNIVSNTSDPNNIICVALKNTSATDTYWIVISANNAGFYSGILTNVTYGTLTSITAAHASLSNFWAYSVNNITNMSDFLQWDFGVLTSGGYELRNINSSTDANEEFTSLFTITPETWQYLSQTTNYFGAYYFGDSYPITGYVFSPDENTTSFINFTGYSDENISEDGVDFINYAQNLVNQSTNSTNINQTCQENWTCTDWGTCLSNGIQERTCTDLNACNTTNYEPSLTRSCTYTAPPCTPNWNCTLWKPVICPSNDTQTRECVDLNICNVTTNQPLLSQTCKSSASNPDTILVASGLIISVVIVILLIYFLLIRPKNRAENLGNVQPYAP